jgi:hypothetical protein
VSDKDAEEERENKDAEIRGDDTHSMDVNIPGRYTTGTEIDPT